MTEIIVKSFVSKLPKVIANLISEFFTKEDMIRVRFALPTIFSIKLQLDNDHGLYMSCCFKGIDNSYTHVGCKICCRGKKSRGGSVFCAYPCIYRCVICLNLGYDSSEFKLHQSMNRSVCNKCIVSYDLQNTIPLPYVNKACKTCIDWHRSNGDENWMNM